MPSFFTGNTYNYTLIHITMAIYITCILTFHKKNILEKIFIRLCVHMI